jgi:hypothetical protein
MDAMPFTSGQWSVVSEDSKPPVERGPCSEANEEFEDSSLTTDH